MQPPAGFGWAGAPVPPPTPLVTGVPGNGDQLSTTKGTSKAAQKAAKAAEKLGYTNVKHLSAGISGWKDAGKPLEKGAAN